MKMTLSALLHTGQAEVTATYRRADPYAVVLSFGDQRRCVEWVISRELLADALIYGRAGLGDVRVTARGDLVVLGLSSPDGTGSAVFRRDDVAELVHATHLVVRPGAESEALDWSDIAGFPGVSP